MATLAQIISFGFTVAGLLALGGAIPPPPQFITDATPYFVIALLGDVAYPREKA